MRGIPRKPLAVIGASVVLVTGMSVIASSSAARSGNRSHAAVSHKRDRHRGHKRRTRTLVLTVRIDRRVFRGASLSASSAADPTAIVAYQGFGCEATVGTGPSDSTATNIVTTNSSEFYFSYMQGGNTYDTVTSNCAGTLPASTTHSTSIVSHNVACKQFNPLNMSAPTIQGYGISTTYPDGLYSETCNTPNFNP